MMTSCTIWLISMMSLLLSSPGGLLGGEKPSGSPASYFYGKTTMQQGRLISLIHHVDQELNMADDPFSPAVIESDDQKMDRLALRMKSSELPRCLPPGNYRNLSKLIEASELAKGNGEWAVAQDKEKHCTVYFCLPALSEDGYSNSTAIMLGLLMPIKSPSLAASARATLLSAPANPLLSSAPSQPDPNKLKVLARYGTAAGSGEKCSTEVFDQITGELISEFDAEPSLEASMRIGDLRLKLKDKLIIQGIENIIELDTQLSLRIGQNHLLPLGLSKGGSSQLYLNIHLELLDQSERNLLHYITINQIDQINGIYAMP